MIYGIFFIFAGYLSGSILFAYLIPKYFYHIDICRLSDDQNPGAFNAFTHTGIRTGTLILLLELAKGFFPVHIALHVLSPTRLFSHRDAVRNCRIPSMDRCPYSCP